MLLRESGGRFGAAQRGARGNKGLPEKSARFRVMERRTPPELVLQGGVVWDEAARISVWQAT